MELRSVAASTHNPSNGAHCVYRCPCGPEDFDIGVQRFARRHCGGTFVDGAVWEKPKDDECRMFSLSARKLCQLALVRPI